jgi:hypothetical protein
LQKIQTLIFAPENSILRIFGQIIGINPEKSGNVAVLQKRRIRTISRQATPVPQPYQGTQASWQAGGMPYA